MVRMRLMRIGQKKQPVYRIVITDKRNARDSRYIESIGYYNPRTQPHTVELHEERALYWLSVGASPSESVQQLLTETGTLDRFARFRAGADPDELLDQAYAEKQAAEPVSPKTSYAAPQKVVSDEPVAQLVEEDMEEYYDEEVFDEEEIADEDVEAEDEMTEEEEEVLAEADVEDEDTGAEDYDEETETEEA
ncbi:MAG: 30S ribosomal protein S16 [Chloroflexi bacterium]|nr:30S ribosomal protein S16 [Chloroflexota bacterium]